MNRMARGGNWSAGIFRNTFSSYKEAKKDRCGGGECVPQVT